MAALDDEQQTAHNKKEVRRMLRASGSYAALAVAAAIAANFSGGVLLVALVALAVALCLVAGWIALWALVVTALLRGPHWRRRGVE